MLTKLIIENIQSHKHTVTNFKSGINAIIGPSGTGKSALVRSIIINLTNQPAQMQSQLIRHGEKGYCITTEDDRNNSITRKKAPGINQYIVNDNVLEAVNKSVPVDVQDIFNFTEINYSSQLSGAFLFHFTSGEIGKYINSIVDLDIMTNCLSNIEKRKNKESRNIEQLEKELTEKETELERYAGLSDMVKDTKKLKKLDNKKNTIIKLISSLKTLYNQYIECKQKYTVDIPTMPEKLLAEYQAIDQKIVLLSEYSGLKDLYDNGNKHLQQLKKELKRLTPDNICPLCGKEGINR